MGSRLLRLGGLLAAASLLVVGCAGDADEIDESESPLTVPPPTSESPTADAVLDLETMTDEELLAEAERAYQGWLDDMETTHEAETDDYLQIDTWATRDFLTHIQEVYVDNRPDGYQFSGVQTLVDIKLIDRPDIDASRYVATAVCLDNSTLHVRGADGEEFDWDSGSPYSSGETYFAVSDDGTRLRIYSELQLEDEDEFPCG